MAKYPIYLDLKDKKVVVIGAGSVAERKVKALCSAGAKVLVVARDIDQDFAKSCEQESVKTISGSYSKEYLKGAVLAIAATNDTFLNKQVYDDCHELSVLCNVVDVPELCDFYVPAVVKRGDLQIAISTDGNCPAYAVSLRKKIEDIFTEDHAGFITELKTARERIIKRISDSDKRKEILQELVNDESFERFINEGPEAWQRQIQELIEQHG
jgi:precorrin-2 dehydrogenase/sirohydrochlorin ferrochelatase